jgi:DNA invertase Pin-like site-specific DNA recombinase
MKVALYARVSTPDQNVETQLRALWRFIEARGWELHREYVDVGYSGKTDSRPELDAMLRDARARKFKVVLVWKFDRMFRSVEHMIDILQEFRALEIDFISMTENIDTTTPAGRLMYHLLASFSEFERDLIRERTIAGMARARAAGKHIGRMPRLVDVEHVRELRKDHSFRQIAKITGISVGRLYSALQEPVQKGRDSLLNASLTTECTEITETLNPES